MIFDGNHLRLLGFVDEGKEIGIEWREIVSIVAFKRDLLTVDSMRIGIETVSGKIYEIGEEANGWIDLIESFPKHLPGCKPMVDWYQDVMFPPFETNLTTIYKLMQNK